MEWEAVVNSLPPVVSQAIVKRCAVPVHKARAATLVISLVNLLKVLARSKFNLAALQSILDHLQTHQKGLEIQAQVQCVALLEVALPGITHTDKYPS